MKKTILILVILVLVVLTAGILARNALIKSASARAIREATGFDLELEKIDIGLLNTSLEIVGLKLLNPAEYKERTAFEVRELFVDYDLFSFFSDEVHLREVRLDIPQMTVEVNERGESNIDVLREAAEKSEAGSPQARTTTPPRTSAPAPKSTPPSEPPAQAKTFRIDDLILRLGKVSYRDYSTGGPEPRTFNQDLGIDIHLKDVTDPAQIMAAIMPRVFMGMLGNASAFADLATDQFGDLAAGNQEQLRELEQVADETITQIGAALEEMAGDPNSPLGQLLGALGGEEANASAQRELGGASETVSGASAEAQEKLGQWADEGGEEAQQAAQDIEQVTEEIRKGVGNFLKALQEQQ